MTFTKILKNDWSASLIAALAGAMLTLSFAPFQIFPFAVLSPAILLALWLDTTAKQGFWRGWCYGLGLFGTGIYWVYISIHVYGYSPVWLASFITAGFVALLAIFPALNGYLLNRFFPYTHFTKILLAFPAIWVLLEWSRSWLFTGFPWLSIGYSQINSPLRGYAPFFSVYGVSLAVLISSGCIVLAIIKAYQKEYKLVYYNLLGLIFLWTVGGCLNFISWTHPVGKPIEVSLIQGNVAQEIKWTQDAIQPTLDLYKKLSAPHWNSRIVIWPEGAIPIDLNDAKNFLDEMNTIAKKNNSALITGIPIKAEDKNAYYNSAIVLGKGEGRYDKHRLVPFGEYIPLAPYLNKLLDILNMPTAASIPGVALPKPLQIDNIKIATFICYEIAFPEQVVSRDGTINMILTISNDAWFGNSIAQPQHLEMARMRAVEMGRPIVFVGNSGLTAIIDATGKITATIPPYVTGVLTSTVQPTTGKTPWQWASLDPLLIILLIMLFVAVRRHRS